jgi:predicted ferric reductase
MKESIEGLAKLERESRQLRRLEVLIDVIFAIVIWRIFILIPRPGTSNWHWDAIGPFLSANVLTFVLVALAIVIVIIYWLQNNALFNNLDRTDSRHTAISIVQIFFLLCFLLSIRLGVVLEASAGTRAFESCTAGPTPLKIAALSLLISRIKKQVIFKLDSWPSRLQP